MVMIIFRRYLNKFPRKSDEVPVCCIIILNCLNCLIIDKTDESSTEKLGIIDCMNFLATEQTRCQNLFMKSSETEA